MNIKKDDKVIVLSGKDKGKQGKVLIADPKGLKVVVEGVNVATKHQKPASRVRMAASSRLRPPSTPARYSLSAPKCGKGTRVAHKITDGKKTRVCKKCGAEI